jgi:hypothetical protein
MNITNLTPQQFRNAADLQEKIDALQNEMNELLGAEVSAPSEAAIGAPPGPKNGRRKRKFSAVARAKMAASQRARWAARRGEAPAEPEQPLETPRAGRSAAHRKALSEAMKARWARLRRAGRSRL